MSSTQTLSFKGVRFLRLSFDASCSTIRISKQLHVDPGKIAVMVGGTHPQWVETDPFVKEIISRKFGFNR